MAERIIVYWRDIPTQVLARAGRRAARRELSPRFMEAVDMAAMRSGARESEDYLAGWRKSDPVPCGEDLEAEADAACNEIEDAFTQERLAGLVKHGGRDP